MTRQNCRNSICRKKIWRRPLRRWRSLVSSFTASSSCVMPLALRRCWVCTRSISFSGFFVLSLAMMARRAEYRPLLHDLHLLGCRYDRGRLTSLCLCKKLGKRDLKSIADLYMRRNGRDRKGLKSPSVQLTTKMRQATRLSGEPVSFFRWGLSALLRNSPVWKLSDRRRTGGLLKG